MRIPKKIIRKISRIIKATSALYSHALPDTGRHLFSQLLFGLLRACSPYASDVARKMEGTSIGAKEMKVLRLVHHPGVSYAQLLEAHIQRLSRIMERSRGREEQRQLCIYGDMSELVKPWALSMDAIDTVRDGSGPMEKEKSGYWLNEVYISPDRGRILPVVLYPFLRKRKDLRARHE